MLSISGKVASYREWKAVDPCGGDPAVLKRDFDSMNALMSEYLTQTGMGIEGTWTDEQVATLDSSQTELPPGIDALSKAVALLKKCKPDPMVASGVKKADDNIREARQRISDAPSMIPVIKAKIVLAKWKADQTEAIKTNRDQWCGGTVKPGTVPDIFYASEDETGKVEYHFCNDVKVVSDGSAKPAVVDPENKAKKKEHQKYVDAALKYPASEVQKAPKVDVKTASAGASAEAKPADAKPAEEAKPAEAKPAEEAKPPEAKKEEAKPAETKKEEPKKEEPKKDEPKGKKEESKDLKPDD